MRIGILPGHNDEDQGAISYNGKSEHEICSEAAKIIFKTYKYVTPMFIELVPLERKAGETYTMQCNDVADQAIDLGVDLVISLHLNSYDGNARGCEGLINILLRGLNSDIERVADALTDYLNESLGIKERGNDGVKYLKPSHRGHKMTQILLNRGIQCVIVEPCFANIRTTESEKIVENPANYANAVIRSIVSTFSQPLNGIKRVEKAAKEVKKKTSFISRLVKSIKRGFRCPW